MKLFKTKCKDTVHAFWVLFVANIVKEKNKKIFAKICLKEKISRPVDQFNSKAEHEIDSIIWYGLSYLVMVFCV